MTNTVLVTGGSGYLAGHIIRRLLDQGERVRATLRSPHRKAAVRGWIDGDASQLTFVAADLTSDREGRRRWPGATTCCMWRFHLGSPRTRTT